MELYKQFAIRLYVMPKFSFTCTFSLSSEQKQTCISHTECITAVNQTVVMCCEEPIQKAEA